MAKKNHSVNFEKSLTELEQLVERMETGELSLEESLKQFERGVALTRICEKALIEAEQKVNVLMEKQEKTELQQFNSGETE